MKKVLSNLAKMAIVAALLYWLAESGKLEFSQLSILLKDPVTLVAAISLWLFGSLLLGSLRWNLLLKGLDINMPFTRALQLQLIGFFFNTAMPGAVGGDVIKALYVYREQSGSSKTNSLLTIILDRIIGLVAIFAIATVAVIVRFDLVSQNTGLMSLALFIGIGDLAIAAVGLLCLTSLFEGRDPFLWLFSHDLPGLPLIKKIYAALTLFRQRPSVIGKTFLISIVVQVMSLLFSFLLALKLTDQSIDFMIYALVHPVGILTTALPLAPGGLGVGHIAFDRLFIMAGLKGGANVFNVMVLSQLALNLVGIVPYLLHKSEFKEILPEAENPQPSQTPQRI